MFEFFEGRLKPQDQRPYHYAFRERSTLKIAFAQHFPSLDEVLSKAGVDYAGRRDFLLGLTDNGDFPMHSYFYSELMKKVKDLVGSLGEKALAGKSLPLSVFADSARAYPESILRGDNYYPKLERTVRAYAKPGDESLMLSSTILEQVKAKVGVVGLSPKSSAITVSSPENQKTKVIAEVFSDRWDNVQMVRVGPLFFLDADMKDEFFSDFMLQAGENLIFLAGMQKTEFRGRLGYYTQNTIAALLNADIRERVVVDFGTGTGILAIVAKKLGAAGVLAVDKNENAIALAAKNAKVNGLGEDPTFKILQADLIEKNLVLSALNNMTSNGSLVIVSNIGAWLEYPISNLTPLSYIPEVGSLRGWCVDRVISGGYNHQDKRIKETEAPFLQKIGVKINRPPHQAEAFDKKVLNSLGFEVSFEVKSEELEQPGSFSHQARSFVARKAVCL